MFRLYEGALAEGTKRLGPLGRGPMGRHAHAPAIQEKAPPMGASNAGPCDLRGERKQMSPTGPRWGREKGALGPIAKPKARPAWGFAFRLIPGQSTLMWGISWGW
jgi:hypothetical protein